MGTTQNKLVTSHQYNKRNKQAVQVLNKVEYDSEGHPIGMMEDPSNPTSANFGTPREPRRGGCYRGDGSSYVDLGNIPSYQVQNFRLTLTIANLNRINPNNKRFFSIQIDNGGMSRGWYLSIYPGGTFYCVFRGNYTTDLYANPQVADKYEVIIEKIGSTAKLTVNEVIDSNSNVSLIYPSGGGRSTLLNLFGIAQNQYANCDIFGVKYYELDDSGNVVSLLGKYNCSENSGTICYDSSGNGNHGQIINAITTTPEENPNSIHQYQDVYSFENEEGYTGKEVEFNILSPHQGTIEEISTGTYKLTSTVEGQNANIFWFRPKHPNQGVIRYVTCEILIPQDAGYTFFFRAASSQNSIGAKTGNWVSYKSINSAGEAPTDRYSFRCNFIKDGEYYLIRNVKLWNRNMITPKNSSITLPPFKDALGNNLQYVGKVPGKAKFVNSSCFKGDGTAYLSIPNIILSSASDWTFSVEGILETNRVIAGNSTSSSNYLRLFTNGDVALSGTGMSSSIRLIDSSDDNIGISTFSPMHYRIHCVKSGNSITTTLINKTLGLNAVAVRVLTETFTVTFDQLFRYSTTTSFMLTSDNKVWNVAFNGITYPLCEPIIDPSNHTYHDVSGNGNHATLINGTLDNEGKQDKFHYLQRGFNFAKIGVNRLPYTDDILNYWTLSRYAEILETGLPDPLGGNKAIRIKYQTLNSPDKNRTVLTKPLTRTYPGSWTPRGNYTISLYVKNAIPGELNSFSLIIRAATKSSDLIATDSWNRFSFYGNHNVDIYSGNGLAIDSLDSSFDLIIFGFQMELGNNLSPYEPTMFIGKRDGYKPKLLNIDKDAEMSENILIPQDSHSFLNTGENGTELEAYDYPALKQADKDDNFWYIGDAGVRRLSHYELAIENLMSDKIFLDTNNNSNR